MIPKNALIDILSATLYDELPKAKASEIVDLIVEKMDEEGYVFEEYEDDGSEDDGW